MQIGACPKPCATLRVCGSALFFWAPWRCAPSLRAIRLRRWDAPGLGFSRGGDERFESKSKTIDVPPIRRLDVRGVYAILRTLGRFGLVTETNRISTRLPSAAAIRRNIAREWPS